MKKVSKRIAVALILSALALATVWWLFLADVSESAFNVDALRKRAQAGDKVSRHDLGEAYRLGQGVEVDRLKAYQWHKKAALQGYADSQYRVGQILQQGDGVRQNLARAFEWYSLASKMSGHREAEFAMAQMYFNGLGVTRDYAEAFSLYEKTAQKGHLIAQHLLGALYEEGWAVKKDYVEAWKWYTLALPGRDQAMALNPLYDPRRALDRLRPRMNKFQVQRGEQRARDWLIEHDDPFD